MQFRSLEEVLNYAISKEAQSSSLYAMFQKIVKNPAAKKLLQELAGQEEGHKKIIEAALQNNELSAIGANKELGKLGFSGHVEDKYLTADSDPQDVMLYAMNMEKMAYDLYSDLLNHYRGTALEGLFRKLADEELRHRRILEEQYEEHFMQWM